MAHCCVFEHEGAHGARCSHGEAAPFGVEENNLQARRLAHNPREQIKFPSHATAEEGNSCHFHYCGF